MDNAGTFIKGNIAALMASGFTSENTRKQYTANDFPDYNSAGISLVDGSNYPAMSGVVHFVNTWVKGKSSVFFEVVDDGSTTFRITVTRSATPTNYDVELADNTDGVYYGFVDALTGEDNIDHVVVTKNPVTGEDTLLIIGDFDAIACSIASGSGTIAGYCDCENFEYALLFRLRDTYTLPWCQTYSGTIEDNYAIPVDLRFATELYISVSSITYDNTLFSTGISPRAYAFFAKGTSV